MVAASRTAILGGDGRQTGRWAEVGEVEIFRAARDGGNGELRRLEAAVKGGAIARVIILARFNGHSATRRIRHLCAARGIPVLVARGSSPSSIAGVESRS